MQVIRLARYAMLRKLWALAVILVFLCALPFVVWATVDKPPDVLFRHVTETAKLVHNGECNLKNMNIANRSCLIFYNEVIDRVWVVLFDKDRDGLPQVTHVLLVDEAGKEVVAWCRQDVCI